MFIYNTISPTHTYLRIYVHSCTYILYYNLVFLLLLLSFYFIVIILSYLNLNLFLLYISNVFISSYSNMFTSCNDVLRVEYIGNNNNIIRTYNYIIIILFVTYKFIFKY